MPNAMKVEKQGCTHIADSYVELPSTLESNINFLRNLTYTQK